MGFLVILLAGAVVALWTSISKLRARLDELETEHVSSLAVAATVRELQERVQALERASTPEGPTQKTPEPPAGVPAATAQPPRQAPAPPVVVPPTKPLRPSAPAPRPMVAPPVSVAKPAPVNGLHGADVGAAITGDRDTVSTRDHARHTGGP